MADFVLVSKSEFLNLDKVETISIEPGRMVLTLDNGAVKYAEPEYSESIFKLLTREQARKT
jgi:hypothetical protein